MTIRETVKQALTHMPGNKVFCIADLITNTFLNQREDLSGSQIQRALRDIPYVKRVNGRYIVKGRKVPARNTVKPISN